MKITAEHFGHMQSEIAKIAHNIPDMRADIATDTRVKDADKRLRWDLSYRAGLSRWICDNLYTYCDDTHIDTALRAIVGEMETA